MRYWPIIFAFFTFVGNAQQPLPAIGLWREHLPYNSAIDLAAASDRTFCATPYSLFSINKKDKTIERYSRVTGLSETGINTIAYDEVNQKLVIAYTNSNVDILYRNDIYNIPDIKRSTVAGDKTIYAIQPIGQNYYLSTGLGVIVLDGERFEIKDSWFIGQSGNPVKVQGFASDGIFFYAATNEGLKKASVNAPNLANHLSWQLIGTVEGLSQGPCQNVFSVANKMFVQKNDSLFVQSGSAWTFAYSDGWPIVNSHSSNGKIMLCERLANGESRVRVLNVSAAVEKTLSQPSVISFPRKAINLSDTVWIADQFGGLSYFINGSFEQFKPNSPESVSSGEMTVYKNVFYATAGSVNDAWNYLNNCNGT